MRSPVSATAGKTSLAPLAERKERQGILLKGLAALALGGALTCLAVIWSNGPLGLLSLVAVFGALAWTSLRWMRSFAASLRRRR